MIKKEEKRKDKKALIAFLFIFAAVGIIISSAFAFFSDVITGSGTATTGTLDITGAYQFYLNGSTTPTTNVNNFNPGDVLVTKANISNQGNKSAWVRDLIDFGTIDANIAPFISIYSGEKTLAQITANPSADILVLTGGKASSAARIIDGSGSGAETETATGAIGGSSYSAAYTIYFNTTATNEAQGKAINFSAVTQALQYRNNTTTPTETQWDTVVTAPYGS